jgi:DNA-binding response OmpR family regulator
MDTVLVVDDEPTIRDVVVRYLRRDGYETLEAGDGDRARDLIETSEPSLVVLDVMLPGTDGLALCRWIRSRSSLPVILLTARGDEVDRIIGLELGADDYVTKPFSTRELTARVKARLRERTQEPRTPEVFHFGSVRVDLRRRILWKDNEESHLTTHEAGTLAYLITHRGRDVSRDELLQEVWGYSAALTTRTVDNQILKLRKKIEETPGQPRHILTVHGTGYRFEP